LLLSDVSKSTAFLLVEDISGFKNVYPLEDKLAPVGYSVVHLDLSFESVPPNRPRPLDVLGSFSELIFGVSVAVGATDGLFDADEILGGKPDDFLSFYASYLFIGSYLG
jgi:hypothetical protein